MAPWIQMARHQKAMLMGVFSQLSDINCFQTEIQRKTNVLLFFWNFYSISFNRAVILLHFSAPLIFACNSQLPFPILQCTATCAPFSSTSFTLCTTLAASRGWFIPCPATLTLRSHFTWPCTTLRRRWHQNPSWNACRRNFASTSWSRSSMQACLWWRSWWRAKGKKPVWRNCRRVSFFPWFNSLCATCMSWYLAAWRMTRWVWMCVCEREKKRDKVCVWERKRERECVYVCVHGCGCVHVLMWVLWVDRGQMMGERKKCECCKFIWTLTLTPSLPWRHLKTTNKSVKSETLKPFCLLFCTGTWRDFHQNTSHWK